MTATQSPIDEACAALVERINTGTEYSLALDATYSEVRVDPLELIDCLRVDVVYGTGKQLQETLDKSDNSSHSIVVWIRSPLPQKHANELSELNYLAWQIKQRLDDWNSSDRRVQVWECGVSEIPRATKDLLRASQLYASRIQLRVEVLP